MAKKTESIVGVKQVAKDFGCSERQIQLYAGSGMPKAGRGKYDRVKCLIWYNKKLKAEVLEARETDALEYEQIREKRASADIREISSGFENQ